MREIRQSGSEGGGVETNRLSLPLLHLNTRVSSTFQQAAREGTVQPGQHRVSSHSVTRSNTSCFSGSLNSS
jgi:hypothetical protein